MRILHGEIIIPKCYRNIAMKFFKNQSVELKLIVKEFNNWLKQFLHTHLSVNLSIPDISQTNYLDLFKFLNEGKTHLNNVQNQFRLSIFPDNLLRQPAN